MTEKKSLLSKRGGVDLGRYLGIGSEQGAQLARGERPPAGESAGSIEDARIQVEEVEAKLATSKRLWEREWASMMLRGVFKTLKPLSDPRAHDLFERAKKLRAMLSEIDRVEFSDLHRRLEAGAYTPAEFKAALGARPHYEWDAFTERLLEIEVVPDRETDCVTDMVHYLASSVDVIFQIIEELRPNETFYDLGSGLGKVALLVAWLGNNRAKGVEYEPAYVRLARARAEKLRIANVAYIEADARAVDYSDGDVFYLYDPFRGPILEAVLESLAAVSKTKPIRLLSRGESSKTLDNVAWLERAKITSSKLSVYRVRA